MKLNCINRNESVKFIDISGKSHWNDIGVFDGLCVSCNTSYRYNCPNTSENNIEPLSCSICGSLKLEVSVFQSICKAKEQYNCKVLLDSESD